MTVDEDRVKAAAAKCDTFKGIAKELWPDTFKPTEEWECVALLGDGGLCFLGGVEYRFRLVDAPYCGPWVRVERRRT